MKSLVEMKKKSKLRSFCGSGGELGSTGRAKLGLRVEVDRLASLKAD